MGVLRALANGIEGKFRQPLERATAIDVRYDHGAIPVVWAAYYLELPWPKRDRGKAAAELKRALEINPANLRARLYQARSAADEGRAAEASALLAAIASAPGDSYDPPEERRVKMEAAKLARTIH
jgi:lipopolysaccharide biosynthesis regulator YciM